MRKTVKKHFRIFDIEKHEEWLNKMSAEGWCLVSVKNGKYEFEQVPPGLFTVRAELLENSANHRQSIEYIEFIKSTGAVYVGNSGKIAYFRKIKDNDFQLYSDKSSRINYYTRLIKYFGGFAVFCGFNLVFRLFFFFEEWFDIGKFDWANLIISVLWLALLIPFSITIAKVVKKRKRLKKQQNLFE